MDLERTIDFSCPNECGQIATACSLRKILENSPFSCEACGFEFYGADYPEWLDHASFAPDDRKTRELKKAMVTVYSFLYDSESCPNEKPLNQLLAKQKDLWKLFPQEKLAQLDLSGLADDKDFLSSFDFKLLSNAGIVRLLSTHPVLLGRCSLDQLTGDNWLELIAAHPEFAALASWDRIFTVITEKSQPAAVSQEQTDTIFNNFPYKKDFRFGPPPKNPANASPALFLQSDVFWAVVNYFRFEKYVDWNSFSPAELSLFFRKYPSLLNVYPFTSTNLDKFDWNSFSTADWNSICKKNLLPKALLPVYLVGTGQKVADCLKQDPRLDKFCNWQAMKSSEWVSLLTAFPDDRVWLKHCNWIKIKKADWDKILSDKKNDYAISIYNVYHGKKIAFSLQKYPDLESFVNWYLAEIPDLLELYATVPRLIKKCPWDKMYDHITSLPKAQRQSIRQQYPALWEKRLELLEHINQRELDKLPAGKYHTILDFFDWEEAIDFSGLSSAQKIDLFSLHPEFGERFGWEKLSSDEKVQLAVRSAEFGNRYGWNRFTAEDEIYRILKEKPEYLCHFDSKHFSRSLWKRLLETKKEELAVHYPLGFWDYLLFRSFDSYKLCSKVSYRWNFFLSLAAFAFFLYYSYDHPCGLRALWTESHGRAVSAVSIYALIAVVWSSINAWIFSGRTPFFTTLISAFFGSWLVTVQYNATFFCSIFTLPNYLAGGIFLFVLIVLCLLKLQDKDLFYNNETGILGVIFSYLLPLLLSLLFCCPLWHSRYLSTSERLRNSPRPFYAASGYYLEKAFLTDRTAQKALTKVRDAIKASDYQSGKQAFDEIAPVYSALPVVKDLKTKLDEVQQKKKKHFTEITLSAARDNDYVKIKENIKKADLSNPEIQFLLGRCYHYGSGGHPINFSKAAEWYRKAAGQKHPGAMNNLADLYMKGQGIPKSERTASRLYRESAEAGYVPAQRNLASLYLKGNGVAEDGSQAYRWFTKAAEQNDSEAQKRAGIMALEGSGIPKNPSEAVKWLKKAAAQSDPEAQYLLGKYYYDGTSGEKNYHEAFKYLTASANNDYIPAQWLLGLCYARGKGVAVDGPAAVRWLTKAAEQDFGKAQIALYKIYHNGKIVPANHDKAHKWLMNAASRMPRAQYLLGLYYWQRKKSVQDLEKAQQLLQRASANHYPVPRSELMKLQQELRKYKSEQKAGQEQKQIYQNARRKFLECVRAKKYREALQWGYRADPNDPAIALHMGYMFYNGQGTNRNIQKAFEYAEKAAAGNLPQGYFLLACCYRHMGNRKMAYENYRKSAEGGHVDGQLLTGVCSYFGDGCSKSYSQAHYWFSKAAERQQHDAEYNLGILYLNGFGVAKNVSTAKKWFRQAAEHGSAEAKRILKELQ